MKMDIVMIIKLFFTIFMVNKVSSKSLKNANNLTSKIKYVYNCKSSYNCQCYDESIMCRNSNITRLPLIKDLKLNSYIKTIKLFKTQLQRVRFRQENPYLKLKIFIVASSNLKSLSIDAFLPSANFLEILVVAKSKLRTINTIKAKQMKALRVISTPYNLLRSVPRFDRFTNVEVINLSNNHLSKVKAGDFPSTVIKLDLSNNKIKSFLKNKNRNNHFARRYKNLQILNLHGNNLHEFSLEAIPKSLKLLNLSHTNLKHIELSGKYFDSNLILDLRSNPIKCTCKFLSQYNTIVSQKTIKFKCEDTGCLRCAYSNKNLNQSQIQEVWKKMCSTNRKNGSTVYTSPVIFTNSTYHIKYKAHASKATKVVVVLTSVVIVLLSVLIVSFYRLKAKISNT